MVATIQKEKNMLIWGAQGHCSLDIVALEALLSQLLWEKKHPDITKRRGKT